MRRSGPWLPPAVAAACGVRVPTTRDKGRWPLGTEEGASGIEGAANEPARGRDGVAAQPLLPPPPWPARLAPPSHVGGVGPVGVNRFYSTSSGTHPRRPGHSHHGSPPPLAGAADQAPWRGRRWGAVRDLEVEDDQMGPTRQ
jgi:hypothetical protein